jgi:hypothetical protein
MFIFRYTQVSKVLKCRNRFHDISHTFLDSRLLFFAISLLLPLIASENGQEIVCGGISESIGPLTFQVDDF